MYLRTGPCANSDFYYFAFARDGRTVIADSNEFSDIGHTSSTEIHYVCI